MKLYIAGLYTSNFNMHGGIWNRLTDNEKERRASVRHHLESFHYVSKQSSVDHFRRDNRKVFLDSGAFSAMTKGVTIDIDKYCQYIQRNADVIEVASVLDGIGDPLKTWQNQQYMESRGVNPLPCFHYGEDEKYLEWYIAHYEYITLGGMVPIEKKQLIYWLDRLWSKYLTDGSGRPRLKVHGFGLTTYTLMSRYPWYSVDSSSWVMQAANGNVTLTDFFKGSIVFMPVSSSHPMRKQAGAHLFTLPEEQRDALIRHLRAQGFDEERLRHEYVTRWTYNSWAFDQLGDVITKEHEGNVEFKAPQPELF